MQLKTGSFITGLLLLTGIIGLIAFLLYTTVLHENYPGIFPYMLAFFFLLNSLFFIVFIRISKKDNSIFIRQFMLLFGAKFFIYLIAAIIVLFLFKKEAPNIAVAAMVLYLLYTGYEVVWLTSWVKRKKQYK